VSEKPQRGRGGILYFLHTARNPKRRTSRILKMASQRASEKVDLIPWDPVDDDHYQRMYSQRIACGWREDEVALWKKEVLAGHVFFYWIVCCAEALGSDHCWL
jgi:hypothetical protein